MSSESSMNEEKTIELPRLNITFIGAGKMTGALGLGIARSNVLGNNSCITLSNPSKKFEQFEKEFKKIVESQTKKLSLKTLHDNIKSIENADIVFLAVKPDIIPIVLKQLSSHWKGTELIISIAAGVTTKQMEELIPSKLNQRVIRVMPNTPSLISCGASALCPGTYATSKDINTVMTLMECVGICKQIVNRKEYLMDSIVGLSGSGPAYTYMFIEALADGGVKCGLTRKDSLHLAAQTVYGAAKMVLETGIHPAILKDNVASPGGTTIAAIKSLEKNGLRYAVIDAVETCTKRATELGQLKKDDTK